LSACLWSGLRETSFRLHLLVERLAASLNSRAMSGYPDSSAC
jgi:hypothetical protein